MTASDTGANDVMSTPTVQGSEASRPDAAHAPVQPSAASPASEAAHAPSATSAAPPTVSPAVPVAATGGRAVLARLRQQKAASAAAAAKRKADAEARRSVTFLYASQTGTAEEIAKSLHDDALGKGFKSAVSAMDAWGHENICAEKTPVLVVVAASTGDGDPPDNSAQAFARLRRAAGPEQLKGVSYSVLGLGDSNYSKFMHVSRVIKRRLQEQGAVEFYACAEADEVDGLEDVVDAWRDGLWEALTDAVAPRGKENEPVAADRGKLASSLPHDFTVKGALLPTDTVVLGVPPVRQRQVDIRLTPHAPSNDSVPSQPEPSSEQLAHRDPAGRYSQQHPFWARVKECRYLTTKECEKRVVHFSLDVSGSGMQFEPGDAMSLNPVNSSTAVDSLLARLQLDGDILIQSAKFADGTEGQPLPHLPLPCSLRHALRVGCDIASPPSKSLLAALAAHCADPREALTLQFLASRDGREAYKLDIAEGRPTLLQLLQRYRSCGPPADLLLETLPPLRPRLYSLTNSPLATPDALECAFHVVEYSTHFGPHQGVATTWLEEVGMAHAAAEAAPPLLLPVHLRPSTGFRPPSDPSVPLIMVGPGTGVAPFRGFLQHRRAQRAQGAVLGESWLFFGNWRPDWDFLYGEELQSFVADGTLSHLHLAWSRVSEQKTYVQAKMQAVGAELCEALLERGGHLYVCGDGAAMAKDVHAAVKAIVMGHGAMDGSEADEFLKDISSSGRYKKDVWL